MKEEDTITAMRVYCTAREFRRSSGVEGEGQPYHEKGLHTR